jgi:hypothetical protein
MSAVAGLEVRQLAGTGVGGEGLEPPPVVVGEAQLGAGVGRSRRTMTGGLGE